MVTQRLPKHLRGISASGRRAGGESSWTWNPAPPPVVWVTLAEVPNFPEPQFPHAEKDKPSPSVVVAEMAVTVTTSEPKAGLRGKRAQAGTLCSVTPGP